MTGPAHYAAAEEHLAIAAGIETDGDQDSTSAWHQRQAQIHATLAHAAVNAEALMFATDEAGNWKEVLA